LSAIRAVHRFAVVAAMALVAPRLARATELPPPPSQLTIDIDAASGGVTYARRLGTGPVLLGGGGGFGLSPIFGTTIATGTHFDPAPHVNLLEVVSAQAFARFELASWLRVDAGVRAALFIHGGENYTSGQLVALFVAPALVWRWLWVGPRISAGFLSEGEGQTAKALTFDYVMLRIVKSW
jgi:hypothetical protein